MQIRVGVINTLSKAPLHSPILSGGRNQRLNQSVILPGPHILELLGGHGEKDTAGLHLGSVRKQSRIALLKILKAGNTGGGAVLGSILFSVSTCQPSTVKRLRVWL